MSEPDKKNKNKMADPEGIKIGILRSQPSVC